MRTLADLFKQSAALHANKACIKVYSPDLRDSAVTTLSFKQFHTALLHKLRELQGSTLQQGDTIAVLADNSLPFLVLVFAATLAGLKVLLISTRVLPEHLQQFLASTHCKLLFVSPGYEELAQASGFTCAQLDPSPAAILSSANMDIDVAVTNTVDGNDCALIMHTSGTTNMPRLVYLSHENILCNQQAVQGSFAGHWTSDDSSLSFLPLYHGYALLTQFLRNVLLGATTVLLQQADSPSPPGLIAALEKTGVSFMCCVPWILKLLYEQVLAELQHGNSHALAVLQKLKFVITAGAPLDRNTGEFFRAHQVHLVTVFGLTEAAGCVLHSSFTDDNWELLQPVMHPGIGFEPLASTQDEYELVLQLSPLLGHSAEAGVEPVPADGNYSTCDTFRRTDDGWIYLGRNDQMYNGPHGEKINPMLFENALAQLPMVKSVFVNGEDLLFNHALVELKEEFAGSLAAKAEILATIQTRINPQLELPARVYPNDVILLEAGTSIPLTPKGSVNRNAARVLLTSRIVAHDAQQRKPHNNDMLMLLHQQVRAYLQLPPTFVVPDQLSLLELGFDSLMILSLRNSLQRLLHVELPLALMLGFPTINTLVATLNHLMAQSPAGQKSGRQLSDPTALHANLAALANPAALQQTNAWSRIPLEQVLFHTAHYLFPFPTYNISMSLLAPRRLTRTEAEQGLRYLETRHEILRAVFTAEGQFRIAQTSFVNAALLGSSEIGGSHLIEDNPQAQALIASYLNCNFDLSSGPVYRYSLIHVTNPAGLTRTLLYIGLHHVAGDFKAFNALVSELMEYLEGYRPAITELEPVGDTYATLIQSPTATQLQSYQSCWRQLLTVMPTLKAGLDFRAGHRQYFRFPELDLGKITGILRKHNISLFNGVYAIYMVALSRHLGNQRLEDFHSATAVTSRVTADTENLMGCFIHSPVLRFQLDPEQSMLQLMAETQRTTLRTFTRAISEPVEYLQELVAEPSNLVPFLSRNVFLYRSPDEIMTPLPGWQCYRNEFFFDSSDVGMYFDFCANRQTHCMEGYVLINLHYCDPGLVQPILDDMRMLLQLVVDDPDLGFVPTRCLQQNTCL